MTKIQPAILAFLVWSEMEGLHAICVLESKASKQSIQNLQVPSQSSHRANTANVGSAQVDAPNG